MLVIVQIYMIAVINVSSITQIDALYAFMYVVALFYGAYMMLLAPMEADETKNKDVMY